MCQAQGCSGLCLPPSRQGAGTETRQMHTEKTWGGRLPRSGCFRRAAAAVVTPPRFSGSGTAQDPQSKFPFLSVELKVGVYCVEPTVLIKPVTILKSISSLSRKTGQDKRRQGEETNIGEAVEWFISALLSSSISGYVKNLSGT